MLSHSNDMFLGMVWRVRFGPGGRGCRCGCRAQAGLPLCSISHLRARRLLETRASSLGTEITASLYTSYPRLLGKQSPRSCRDLQTFQRQTPTFWCISAPAPMFCFSEYCVFFGISFVSRTHMVELIISSEKIRRE